ncbi:hypothetical protein LO55_1274 [Massilia timonae]|uniref:Uncharacterized protein n=1 Tax=Massilia timonae TaxID=47229 RepID=A0A1S2N5W1_9BURK|nr:hypothetical protein LO55_1274 [Massilia timonae]
MQVIFQNSYKRILPAPIYFSDYKIQSVYRIIGIELINITQ